MEIERKWLVNGWPEKELELLFEQEMEQSYVTVRPTVRIRKEQIIGEKPEYVFCLKSKSEDGMSREEIEFNIDQENFERIEKMIGKPAIIKHRKTYGLLNGLKLEVNCVDAGTANEVWYAEVEYPTLEACKAWNPEEDGLEDYLSNETTGDGSYTMGAFWMKTRGACD